MSERSSRSKQGGGDRNTERSDETDDFEHVNYKPNLRKMMALLSDLIPAVQQELDDVMNETRTKSEIAELKTEIDDLKKEVKQLENECKAMFKEKSKTQNDLDQAKERLRKTKEELDDTKSRLSRQMGGKLADNNPHIADLSDKNRPTKISERYQELYDNQWTDAFEALDKKYHDEKKTVSTLIKLLLNCTSYCKKEADYQMQQLRTVLTMSQDKTLPTNVHKQIKDCRKELAEISVQRLFEDYKKHLMNSDPDTYHITTSVLQFFKECFEICWLMAVQDPQLEFGQDVVYGETFDKNLYKPYTRSGDKVDFIVWPVLLLHKDGPVLFKGIAQCYGEIRRVNSAPPERTDKFSDYSRRSESKSSVANRIKPLRPAWEEENSDITRTAERPYGQVTVRTIHTGAYDSHRKEDRQPTNKELDRFFDLRDRYGATSARITMGETYDICLRYIKRS